MSPWGVTLQQLQDPHFPGQAQAVFLCLCRDPLPIPAPAGQPPAPCRAPQSGLRPEGTALVSLHLGLGAGLGLPHCAQGSEQSLPLPSPRPLRPRCPVSLFKAVSAREGPFSCQRHRNPADPFLKPAPLRLVTATLQGGW